MNKDSFQVYIHIFYDGKGNFFVSKIKVDKFVEKIIRIPVSIDVLTKLLLADGLDLHPARNCKLSEDIRIFVINLPQYKLEKTVVESDKSEVKKMNLSIIR